MVKRGGGGGRERDIFKIQGMKLWFKYNNQGL